MGNSSSAFIRIGRITAVTVGNHSQLFLHGHSNFVVVNREHSGLENYWKDIKEKCELKDEDDTHNLSAPIEEAGISAISITHLLNSQKEEIPYIDVETLELIEGVRQLNISQPEPKRVQAVWKSSSQWSRGRKMEEDSRRDVKDEKIQKYLSDIEKKYVKINEACSS
ncbi:hypothetical protein RclHR1_01760019 [Rhizophagus clarus]|uniref:Uncharacterized protein n=1 Tax=Rhizophagus clarus TaxID=94130 RepID=A0A2Z6QLY3_9GLOM|nr:hypothetical protein RclHR1_01760019 [Rhizophagus clarus]